MLYKDGQLLVSWDRTWEVFMISVKVCRRNLTYALQPGVVCIDKKFNFVFNEHGCDLSHVF